MATLHVRNVPDQLYERLRERATAGGRSIGAQVVVMLEQELGITGARPWRTMFARRRAAPTPFHRFSPRARGIVAEAKEEARGLGDQSIGTEHLLLAILRTPATIASFVLEQAGIDYEQIHAAAERVPRERVEAPDETGLPFTPGAKKAMELALRCSIDLGATHIGPEHLLFGIAREEEGLGARILADAGQDVQALRRALALPPDVRPYALRVEVAPGFRVIDLSGSAEDWEGQLNGLAARGYELVEIVSGKAIFRVQTQEP